MEEQKRVVYDDQYNKEIRVTNKTTKIQIDKGTTTNTNTPKK